ncbi:hypothetical protein Trydic_g16747 [Trypoxylus dichotomus]
MNWCPLGGGCVRKLVQITERRTNDMYLDILQEYGTPAGLELVRQQFNDSNHVAVKTLLYSNRSRKSSFIDMASSLWDYCPIASPQQRGRQEIHRCPPAKEQSVDQEEGQRTQQHAAPERGTEEDDEQQNRRQTSANFGAHVT